MDMDSGFPPSRSREETEQKAGLCCVILQDSEVYLVPILSHLISSHLISLTNFIVQASECRPLGGLAALGAVCAESQPGGYCTYSSTISISAYFLFHAIYSEVEIRDRQMVISALSAKRCLFSVRSQYCAVHGNALHRLRPLAVQRSRRAYLDHY